MDLARLHQAIAGAIPRRECVVWRDARITWSEMDDTTAKLAAFLHQQGLGRRPDSPGANRSPWSSPHDHLGLYLMNCPAYLEGLIGAHKASVAPFNINYRYIGDELVYLLRDVRPAGLMFHSRFGPVLQSALERTSYHPLLIQVSDDSDNTLIPNAFAYESILDSPTPTESVADTRPDDLHILYTGGTTGMPKGVLWRSEDLLHGPLGLSRRDGSPITSESEAVERAAQTKGRVLVTPPLMHGSGTWLALGAMYHGRTVVFPHTVERLDPVDIIDTCFRESITRVMVVGDAFARPIIEELETRQRTLTSVHHLLNSGAVLRPDFKRRLSAVMPNAKIIDTVGASESGPQAMRESPSETAFHLLPGGAVLHEDLASVVRPGETGIGWLATSGAVPQGYLDDPLKTARTFPVIDGIRYAVPGDKVVVLDDGTIKFIGRESGTINTGGEKVFAEEIESVIRGLSGVIDIHVVGRPSEEWGEEVVAIVQLESTARPTTAALSSSCREHLSGYKIPKAFIFVPLVERLPNGKIDTAWVARILSNPIS